MKKLFAILLALTLLFAISAVSLAEPEDGKASPSPEPSETPEDKYTAAKYRLDGADLLIPEGFGDDELPSWDFATTDDTPGKLTRKFEIIEKDGTYAMQYTDSEGNPMPVTLQPDSSVVATTEDFDAVLVVIMTGGAETAVPCKANPEGTDVLFEPVRADPDKKIKPVWIPIETLRTAADEPDSPGDDEAQATAERIQTLGEEVDALLTDLVDAVTSENFKIKNDPFTERIKEKTEAMNDIQSDNEDLAKISENLKKAEKLHKDYYEPIEAITIKDDDKLLEDGGKNAKLIIEFDKKSSAWEVKPPEPILKILIIVLIAISVITALYIFISAMLPKGTKNKGGRRK